MVENEEHLFERLACERNARDYFGSHKKGNE